MASICSIGVVLSLSAVAIGICYEMLHLAANKEPYPPWAEA